MRNTDNPPLLSKWVATIFDGMNNAELKSSQMHFSWRLSHFLFNNIQRIIAWEIPQVPISEG